MWYFTRGFKYKNKYVPFYLAIILLFFPLYSTPNIGGTGLAITYNIPPWIITSWIIATALFVIVKTKTFFFPQLWVYFIAFPITLVINSLLTETHQPIAWLFRVLYIFIGLLFLVSMFQFRITQRVVDRCLLFIVIATGLHALIGSIQITSPLLLSPWFPQQPDLVPRSLFQQVNAHMSFLATGLIISLYIISRPSFRYSTLLTKTTVVFSFSLAVYILAASGSRIGFISILLGIPLILWSRYKTLKFQKKILIILLITSSFSFIAGQSGLNKTIDKLSQLQDDSYSTARIAMYTIGLELVLKKPIQGYGIGNFLKAWNRQTSDFVARHPETNMPDYILHPHNEILFWMIEGGLLSLAGILAVVAGIGISLYHLGFQRGGAYTAMLLPISLHTQVEHPFYVSSVLWFLWLFLIFLALRHQSKVINVSLSLSAKRLIQLISILIAIGTTVFMIKTSQAQSDLYNFLYETKKHRPYLQVAMHNIYFKPEAVQVDMRALLHSSIAKKDKAKVELYVKWANEQIKYSPKFHIYEDLISASQFLKPEEKGCDAIKTALEMYAYNKIFQSEYSNCQ